MPKSDRVKHKEPRPKPDRTMSRAESLARWERQFPERKDAPPRGWTTFLRDGWSQNIDEWRRRYRLYLRSWAWKQRRQGAISRARGICALCLQSSTRLQVHHVDYMRVGSEQVEDLRVLCKSCHGVLHTMPRVPNIPMDPATQARVTARDLRQEAKRLKQQAAALAAGAARIEPARVRPVTPDPEPPRRIRRRPGGAKPAA